MYPYVRLLNKNISTYGIVAFIGMLAAILYAFIVHKATKDKRDFFDRFIFIVYGTVFGAIGAGLFYQFTMLKTNFDAVKHIFSDFHYFLEHFNWGLVFYGGMFGFYFGYMVYARYFKEDTRDWIRTSAAGFPLFHAFGRIGCTIGGCCFGKVIALQQTHFNKDLSIYDLGNAPMFAHGGVYNARVGAYCIPIQLIEAAGIFAIFLIVLLYQIVMKNKTAYYRPLGLYFVLYGILRFITEMWRGDLIRGIYGPFSFSQYISMFVIPLGLYCLFCPAKYNFLEKWYNGEQYRKKTSKEVQIENGSEQ